VAFQEETACPDLSGTMHHGFKFINIEHRTTNFEYRTSLFSNPKSAIRNPTSNIRIPQSDIRNPPNIHGCVKV
jgi:hypothetical protein